MSIPDPLAASLTTRVEALETYAALNSQINDNNVELDELDQELFESIDQRLTDLEAVVACFRILLATAKKHDGDCQDCDN